MPKQTRAPSRTGTASVAATDGFARPPTKYTIANSIAHQVRTTHRCFVEAIEPKLAKYGLTLGMWYFLRSLWEEDGLTQTEIAHRLGIEATSAGEHLQTLEKRGLVVRRRSSDDRRKVHIFLTDDGVVLKERLTPLIPHMNSVALRGLNAGEVGFLRLVLSRIRANLREATGESWPGSSADELTRDASPRKRTTA